MTALCYSSIIHQKLKTMKKSFLALTSATLFISLVMLSSCKKDEEVTKSYAKVLVTHASPNAPGVDLLVDNSKQNTAALNFL